MKQIRILIPLHVMPTEKHITTMLFENLLPALRTKANVSVFWLVYSPKKLDSFEIPNELGTVIDIHNFKNFVEVIEHVKPDIIYENEDRGIIDLTCELTANYFDIPVIVPINNVSVKSKFSKHYQLNHFFHIVQTIFRKENVNKKQSNHKSIKAFFYFYKFNFLLKTLRVLKKNPFNQIKIFNLVFKSMLSEKPLIYPFSLNNLYRLESETLIEHLVKLGFKKSNLYVTGNPMYDESFKKLKSLRATKNTNKIRVLLAPQQLYENGLWSKTHQDATIQQIVSEISDDSELLLTMKIHPSSVVLSDYEDLVKPINPNLKIAQSGDVFDYLINADVLVSLSAYSTMFVYALVLRKPIILCNFFNKPSTQLVEENLVIECKQSKFLAEQIKSSVSNNPISEKSIDDFLKENFYKTDGQASERLANAIIDFLNK